MIYIGSDFVTLQSRNGYSWGKKVVAVSLKILSVLFIWSVSKWRSCRNNLLKALIDSCRTSQNDYANKAKKIPKFLVNKPVRSDEKPQIQTLRENVFVCVLLSTRHQIVEGDGLLVQLKNQQRWRQKPTKMPSDCEAKQCGVWGWKPKLWTPVSQPHGCSRAELGRGTRITMVNVRQSDSGAPTFKFHKLF